jgi:hypothetical protein
MKRIESCQDEAATFNLTFNGMQEMPSGPAIPVYTDNVTGSSFMVEKGKKTVDALNDTRRNFGVEEFHHEQARQNS